MRFLFLVLLLSFAAAKLTAENKEFRLPVAKQANPDFEIDVEALLLEPNVLDSNLVIGYLDENEVMTISEDMYLYGNILLVNNGTLNIECDNFAMEGTILVTQNSTLNIENCTFNLIQGFAYEHYIRSVHNGVININNTTINSNSKQMDFGVFHDSKFTFKNSTVNDGFITCAFFQNSEIEIENVVKPGEYLAFESSSIKFKDCDTILYWYVLPEESKVDITLPDGEHVSSWEFHKGLEGVENIDYKVEIENCNEVWWGLISNSDSECIFRDSEFRVIGIQTTKPDSVYLSGFTNQLKNVNKKLDISDRNLTLENCDVRTWNIYASYDSQIRLENSVVGEILGQGESTIQVFNTVCDGSGGYLGAFNTSKVQFVHSLCTSSFISRDRAVLFAIHSSMMNTEIDANEASVMLLANTTKFVEPRAHDTSLIVEIGVMALRDTVDKKIPIFGTARTLSGPHQPLEFLNYSYGYEDKDEIRTTLVNGKTDPMNLETIAVWDTKDLEPGQYKQWLVLDFGTDDDPNITSPAILIPKSEKPSGVGIIKEIEQLKVFPNPATNLIQLDKKFTYGSEYLISNMEGRIVKRGKLGDNSQIDTLELETGTYLLEVISGNSVRSSKFQIVR
jgi:hypothetical protein